MIFYLFILFFLFSSPSFADTWKLKYSKTLQKQVGSAEYSAQTFSTKGECQRGVDDALRREGQSFMRKHYSCVLASRGSPFAKSAGGIGGRSVPTNANQKAVADFGSALVSGFFTPEQIGHNIAGENNFKDFGGKKPDALGRHEGKFGFLAKTPKEEAAQSEPHELPKEKPEEVCSENVALSCYSTRAFIGCCPKGFSYLAAPFGMAHQEAICGTQKAKNSNQVCGCFKDNPSCTKSKMGMCYGCSE